MKNDSPLDILKSAILLEKRGRAFYAKVAEHASVQAVKDFFAMMADEEEKHIQVLTDQYRAYVARPEFQSPPADSHPSSAFSSAILSDRLKRELHAAEFEAAAIAAALAMERSAIELYSGRAAAASDPEERRLYQWLADWEKEHLEFLGKIDRDVTEAAWNDAHFWPY